MPRTPGLVLCANFDRAASLDDSTPSGSEVDWDECPEAREKVQEK